MIAQLSSGKIQSMATAAKDKLVKLVESLIAEGHGVIGSEFTNRYMGQFEITNPTTYVDLQQFAKWRAGCVNLLRLLGKYAEPWSKVFADDGNRLSTAKEMVGTLEGMKTAIETDLLVTVEDLVFAEAFSDLLEQADHLLENGFFLAAGVLGRAVLEEHLRKWCDKEGCVLATPKPTMSHFYTELQKVGHLNKLQVASVQAMAASGNEAAHNTGKLTQADAEKLIRDVRDFLVRHPLS